MWWNTSLGLLLCRNVRVLKGLNNRLPLDSLLFSHIDDVIIGCTRRLRFWWYLIKVNMQMRISVRGATFGSMK